jgi:hypothetical protein
MLRYLQAYAAGRLGEVTRHVAMLASATGISKSVPNKKAWPSCPAALFSTSFSSSEKLLPHSVKYVFS